MSSTLTLCLIALFFGLVYAQDQCDPRHYASCGQAVKVNGYAATCNDHAHAECRDCIGCNHACPWFGQCIDYGCSVGDYIEAGQYIADNKDKLGWLNLCCESNRPDISKCVGCQQANIFGILCGFVYPGLRSAFGAKSVQLNAINTDETGFNVNDKTSLFVGIELVGIGTILGIVLVLTMILLVCVVKKNKQNLTKAQVYKMVNFENDLEKEDE